MSKALRPARWFVVPLAWLVLSCGGDSEPSDTTRNLSIQGGDNQSAAVGAAVATAPSVKVGNSTGTGVSGVSVTFAVASGGGTVTGGTQTTNAQGIATVGGWTLGQATGPNSLAVTVAGSTSTVTINATATAGPPATLAKTAGDNQNAAVKAAVATRPAVRVNDQFGNPVPGATIVFTVTAGAGTITGGTQTTDAQGVAAVGSWTLGPTNGNNRLSAAVQGVAAIQPQVFTANGQEIVIQPAADTVFQTGTINLTRLVIAAGRTVTLAGNVIINADSTVEIAGTITGNCVAFTLNGEQAVTVSGVINNACVGGSDAPPGLKIVAKGGYTFTGAGAITSSGPGEVTNDPTLTDNDLPPASGPALRASPRPSAATLNHVPCHVQKPFRADPVRAKDGVEAKKGTDGKNASNGWTLRCRGADLDLGTGTSVTGQDGGHGGNGKDDTPGGDPGDAEGGAGGTGGLITIHSTGRVVISGVNVRVRSGHGGDGGDASAKGIPNKPGQKAASAKAKGGSGRSPGSIRIHGDQGVTGGSNLIMELGHGGQGGDATAAGADGVQGLSPSEREQDGGDADAEGGAGGNVPDKHAAATGNTTGVPDLQGGTGGEGGDALARAGNGAAGTKPKPDGGHGGSNKGVGGKGGNADAKGFPPPVGGQRFADGGDGGGVVFQKALGADGYDNCVVPLGPRAGDGGKGGGASGTDGLGGNGAADGDPGGVTYVTTGNGANGGDDFTDVGDGGAAGTSTVTEHPPVVGKDTSFKPGNDGEPCPQLIEASHLEIRVKHIIFVSPCPQFMAIVTVTNVSDVPITLSRVVIGTLVVTVSGGATTLPPGGSTTFQVQFNCLQPFSFTGILRLTATPIQAGPPAGATARAAALEPQVLDINLIGEVVMRAVRLAQPLGAFTAGSLIQQSRVTNWLFFGAHPPNCATDHLHATVPAGILIDGQGPFPDPAQPACGYGAIEEVPQSPAPAPAADVKAARRPRGQ